MVPLLVDGEEDAAEPGIFASRSKARVKKKLAAGWLTEGAIREEKTLKKVLFVCTANICRRPMAEALFNVLAEDRGLGFRAESAGVAALRGEYMAPKASAALEEIGVYTEGHSARQVSAKMLEEADLVLTMSPWHVAELHRIFGDSFLARVAAYVLRQGTGSKGILDPYGSTIVAYRVVVRQLFGYINLLVGHLAS